MSGIVASVTGSAVAGAVAGAGILGAVTSRNASKRASRTAGETTDQQLEYMAAAEDRARNDINTLIPAATQQRLQGNQRAMDLLGQGAPMTMGALQQGNMGAQDILAGGMPQIQNALMGGNVDYSFMQPRQLNVDLQSLLSGVPNVYEQPQMTVKGPNDPFNQSNYNSPQPMPNPNVGAPAGGGGGRMGFFNDQMLKLR